LLGENCAPFLKRPLSSATEAISKETLSRLPPFPTGRHPYS
jgi:hypothetical protein